MYLPGAGSRRGTSELADLAASGRLHATLSPRKAARWDGHPGRRGSPRPRGSYPPGDVEPLVTITRAQPDGAERPPDRPGTPCGRHPLRGPAASARQPARIRPELTASGGSDGGHVHEAAVVPLEGDCHGGCRAVSVLRHYQVRLARARRLRLVGILPMEQDDHV